MADGYDEFAVEEIWRFPIQLPIRKRRICRRLSMASVRLGGGLYRK